MRSNWRAFLQFPNKRQGTPDGRYTPSSRRKGRRRKRGKKKIGAPKFFLSFPRDSIKLQPTTCAVVGGSGAALVRGQHSTDLDRARQIPLLFRAFLFSFPFRFIPPNFRSNSSRAWSFIALILSCFFFYFYFYLFLLVFLLHIRRACC